MKNGGRDAGRDPVAHRPALRRELGAVPAIAVEPVQPLGEVPRAVGDDGVFRQNALQVAHDMGEIERAGIPVGSVKSS